MSQICVAWLWSRRDVIAVYLPENKFAKTPCLKPVKYFRAPKCRFLLIKINYSVNMRPI